LMGVPGIQADADLAVAVVKPAGDEVARVRDEIDNVAVGRRSLHLGDGPGIDPRMPAVERPGAPRVQDHSRGNFRGLQDFGSLCFWCAHGSARSTPSM